MRVLGLHGFLGRGCDWNGPDLFSPASKIDLSSFVSTNKYFNSMAPNYDWAIGYSFGGRLLLSAFCAQPELWRQIILIGAHPGLANEAEKIRRREQDQAWAHKILNYPWDEWTREWDNQEIFAGSEKIARDERLFSKQKLATAMIQLSPAHQNTPLDIISKYKSKITWVVGEYDKKYLDLYKILKSEGVIEKLILVPNRGHRISLLDKSHFSTGQL